MKKGADRLTGSSVMVTGGCGFIGAHLVKRLLELKAKRIVVIDNLSYGSKKNLDEIKDKVTVIRHTLGSREDAALFDILKGIDYVFHLAALKHNQSNDLPACILSQNINGTFNLCEAAVKNKVKKIVFSSSVYAYGRTHRPALKESELPHPATIYGISKLAGEYLFSRFFREYNLHYIALRYFFVYGPGQLTGTGYKTVIVKNFQRIMHNQSPIISGDGRQALDYIYIDDVIDATVRAMESEYSAEVFNVGSSEPISINHLIDTMLKVSGKSLKKKYLPPDNTAGTYRVADISKIKSLLHFKPQVTLEEGLRKAYKWLRQQERVVYGI
jgi:UDP-glucose 4-epimerase